MLGFVEMFTGTNRELSSVDLEINGPRNFHSMMEKISQQLKYLDLTDQFDAPW